MISSNLNLSRNNDALKNAFCVPALPRNYRITYRILRLETKEHTVTLQLPILFSIKDT